MQTYKGCFIEGKAMLVHPFSREWYVGGDVLATGRLSSIVEVGRFELRYFTIEINWPNGTGLSLPGLPLMKCLTELKLERL